MPLCVRFKYVRPAARASPGSAPATSEAARSAAPRGPTKAKDRSSAVRRRMRARLWTASRVIWAPRSASATSAASCGAPSASSRLILSRNAAAFRGRESSEAFAVVAPRRAAFLGAARFFGAAFLVGGGGGGIDDTASGAAGPSAGWGCRRAGARASAAPRPCAAALLRPARGAGRRPACTSLQTASAGGPPWTGWRSARRAPRRRPARRRSRCPPGTAAGAACPTRPRRRRAPGRPASRPRRPSALPSRSRTRSRCAATNSKSAGSQASVRSFSARSACDTEHACGAWSSVAARACTRFTSVAKRPSPAWAPLRSTTSSAPSSSSSKPPWASACARTRGRDRGARAGGAGACARRRPPPRRRGALGALPPGVPLALYGLVLLAEPLRPQRAEVALQIHERLDALGQLLLLLRRRRRRLPARRPRPRGPRAVVRVAVVRDAAAAPVLAALALRRRRPALLLAGAGGRRPGAAPHHGFFCCVCARPRATRAARVRLDDCCSLRSRVGVPAAPTRGARFARTSRRQPTPRPMRKVHQRIRSPVDERLMASLDVVGQVGTHTFLGGCANQRTAVSTDSQIRYLHSTRPRTPRRAPRPGSRSRRRRGMPRPSTQTYRRTPGWRAATTRAAGAATAASAASRSRRQCRLPRTATAATARRVGRPPPRACQGRGAARRKGHRPGRRGVGRRGGAAIGGVRGGARGGGGIAGASAGDGGARARRIRGGDRLARRVVGRDEGAAVSGDGRAAAPARVSQRRLASSDGRGRRRRWRRRGCGAAAALWRRALAAEHDKGGRASSQPAGAALVVRLGSLAVRANLQICCVKVPYHWAI